MRNPFSVRFLAVLISLMIQQHFGFAQSDTLSHSNADSSFSSDFSIEMKSSYYWRGTYNDSKPCIQPTYEVSYRNFGLELFGSSNVDNTYQEFDWSLSYQLSAFKFSVADYYYDFSKTYFDYSINNPHLIDASIQYETGDENTFSILVSSIIWGDDKYKDYNISARNSQNYSSYIETSYTVNLEKSSYLFLIGATPHKGMYANKIDVVNLGIEYEKSVAVTKDYSISPLFGVWVNPSSSMLFFSCGIRF